MKKISFILFAAAMMFAACGTSNQNENQNDNSMNTALQLTQEWDKVFPQSDKVDHKKVTFKNRYGITLAADLYIPKDNKSTRQ